jgi:hypothetical protein
MADQNDKTKKSGHGATSVILAFSAILAAAPTLGIDQAMAKHGEGLTEEERTTLKSLSTDEVQALSSINTQLEAVAPAANNNKINNH